MAIRGYNVLAMLRRGRRAIALGVLPALLATLLTTAACPAMSAAPPATNPHSAQHAHAAHEHHAHHDTAPAPAQPTGDCPHCLGGHAAGNVATADCDVAAAAPAAPAQALPDSGYSFTLASFTPLAASVVPPLIGALPRTRAAPLSSVPLHLRHCVLLI